MRPKSQKSSSIEPRTGLGKVRKPAPSKGPEGDTYIPSGRYISPIHRKSIKHTTSARMHLPNDQPERVVRVGRHMRPLALWKNFESWPCLPAAMHKLWGEWRLGSTPSKTGAGCLLLAVQLHLIEAAARTDRAADVDDSVPAHLRSQRK